MRVTHMGKGRSDQPLGARDAGYEMASAAARALDQPRAHRRIAADRGRLRLGTLGTPRFADRDRHVPDAVEIAKPGSEHQHRIQSRDPDMGGFL